MSRESRQEVQEVIVTDDMSESEWDDLVDAVHDYVSLRWRQNQLSIYYCQNHELVVRLPGGVVESVIVTPEEIERGWPTG